MAMEIERKFLVTADDWRSADGVLYRQGYLNRDKARTVRVRIAGNEAFLTVKGKTTGISRSEFEYAIPVADAQAMLALCDGALVEKIRRKIAFAGLIWEVDEFFGDNAGLVVAEVELASADQAFDKPSWIGAEVSDDPRYFNASLSTYPYSAWQVKDEERMVERSGLVGVG
jgi:CYTH domain-containing protein